LISSSKGAAGAGAGDIFFDLEDTLSLPTVMGAEKAELRGAIQRLAAKTGLWGVKAHVTELLLRYDRDPGSLRALSNSNYTLEGPPGTG
jgi:hypothetical protein